jgi:Ig-like domain from next to BRCA1 gene
MSRRYPFFCVLTALLMLVLPSCNVKEAATNPENFYTQAAETAAVAEALTSVAVSPTPSETPTQTISTTLEASNTPLLTLTSTPGGPTDTPKPTNTQKPAQSQACDNAQFIDNITMPDFSDVPAGQTFKMTWRFKNLGPCTWTTDYRILFSYVSDTGKNGVFNPPAPANFPDNTAPGELADISITMTAPTKVDGYQVVFRLQNDKGFNFGPEFWLIFKVVSP